MKVTTEQLKAVCIYGKVSKLETYIKPLNDAMAEFGIDSPLRVAAFLAQICHESGSFNYVEELYNGSRYDERKDLGNTEPEAVKAAAKKNTTTGRFYKGHGLIQITGYYNHRDCGNDLGLDLVNNPKLLTTPVNACRSAGWFWQTRGLNQYADMKDLKKITLKINGGYNGLEDRSKYYIRGLRVFV